MSEPTREQVLDAIDAINNAPRLRGAVEIAEEPNIVAALRAMLAEAERERDEARTVAQSLHGLVESACLYWRGSMPVPTENESMAVAQDRLTERDLIRQADVWVSTLAPADLRARQTAEQAVIEAGLRQRAACRAKDVLGIDKGFVDLIAALDALAALSPPGQAAP